MSRRHAAERREVLPDAKFGDIVLTKFINSLMYEGKKSVAEKIVYSAFDRIQKRTGHEPLRVFHDALGRRRLAGIDVRHDADVAITVERSRACHNQSPRAAAAALSNRYQR